jgi:hypothetical protein
MEMVIPKQMDLMTGRGKQTPMEMDLNSDLTMVITKVKDLETEREMAMQRD